MLLSSFFQPNKYGESWRSKANGKEYTKTIMVYGLHYMVMMMN